MPKSAKPTVRDSSVGGKKKAAAGKVRAQAPQGVMSPSEKDAALKVNITNLKNFGIKPDKPTDLFVHWEKKFYVIDPAQLIPLRNVPFDLEACKAEPQRLTEARENRAIRDPLTIAVSCTPFGGQLEAHRSEKNWQFYHRGENNEVTHYEPIDAAKPCFSDDDVLAMYAGHLAITTASAVVPFVQLFILSGHAPITLKAGKKYDKDDTDLFFMHKNMVSESLEKMFLLYPTKVDPMVDMEGTAFTEGELERFEIQARDGKSGE